MTGRVLTRAEIADLADRVAAVLADPDAELSPAARAHWEGAAAALAYVLGEVDRLPVGDPRRFGL
jgi:hypothetical protein